MESTSKTMSAMRTRSNANNASQIPFGIVTEIGTQEISAKAEFISQETGETKVTGWDMPILSDNSFRRRSFPDNRGKWGRFVVEIKRCYLLNTSGKDLSRSWGRDAGIFDTSRPESCDKKILREENYWQWQNRTEIGALKPLVALSCKNNCDFSLLRLDYKGPVVPHKMLWQINRVCWWGGSPPILLLPEGETQFQQKCKDIFGRRSSTSKTRVKSKKQQIFCTNILRSRINRHNWGLQYRSRITYKITQRMRNPVWY